MSQLNRFAAGNLHLLERLHPDAPRMFELKRMGSRRIRRSALQVGPESAVGRADVAPGCVAAERYRQHRHGLLGDTCSLVGLPVRLARPMDYAAGLDIYRDSPAGEAPSDRGSLD